MAQDIIIKDGDLDSRNGDFVVDYVDEQYAEDIVVANKGEYKQSPVTGIGIVRFFHAPLSAVEREKLRKDALLQFESDGMKKASVIVSENGEITIKGIYE